MSTHIEEIKAFNEKIGFPLTEDDWSHTSIMNGGSGCCHLPKYLICLSDSMDANMMSRESLYDYLREISIGGLKYNIYKRDVGCIECQIIAKK
jgi:hypothetical protein